MSAPQSNNWNVLGVWENLWRWKEHELTLTLFFYRNESYGYGSKIAEPGSLKYHKRVGIDTRFSVMPMYLLAISYIYHSELRRLGHANLPENHRKRAEGAVQRWMEMLEARCAHTLHPRLLINLKMAFSEPRNHNVYKKVSLPKNMLDRARVVHSRIIIFIVWLCVRYKGTCILLSRSTVTITYENHGERSCLDQR